MTWHNAVYGSRNGSDALGRPFDDGPVYGRVPDELIPEERLRRLGGKSFYRAHEVIDSARIHDLGYAYTDDSITLTALVDSADGYADDYSVTAHVDQGIGDLTASHCTCPAYGRFGAICKHVIALIMAYDEDPDAFESLDEDGGDPSPAARPRPRRSPRTSRRLQAFMREREQSRQSDVQSRQLTLLKEIDAMSSSGGSTGAQQGGVVSRHLPIGSVVLRPELRRFGTSWAVRLRLTVPSRSVAYVVKDVAAFIDTVRHQEFHSYGRKLAFVHTRDTLSERSRIILDVLERAVRIRESVTGGAPFYRRGAEADTVLLTGDEIGELLAAFVDADAFLDYERPYRMRTEPVRVVDGDPDLGLALVWSDDAEGYVARHRLDVLDIVEGASASFVAVAPSLSESLASRAEASGEASGGDEVRIHRCSQAFMRARQAIDVLCGTERGEDMVVAASDTDLFMRTVAPLFTPMTTDDAAGDRSESEMEAGESGSDVQGIPIRLPEEMLRLRREPCAIEIYLDRDPLGVTCDVQARYGDRRYHAFEGTSEDAARRDRDAERLAAEAVLHYFPRPDGPLAFLEESDDDAIWRLITEGLPVMRGLGEVFTTPAFDGLLAAPRPTIRLGLSVRSGLVEISPIADEIDPEDVPGLLASYRRRRRFHRLRNGAFLDMSAVDAGQAEETLSDLDLTLHDLERGPAQVPATSAYYLDAQVDDEAKDEGFRAYVDGLRVVDPQSYAVPASLAEVLRPYQVEGFRWLNAVCDKGFGGILADEMGLGKTVQLLSLLVARRDEARAVGPNLIVCPASLVYNWEAECRRFAPGLRVAVVAGSKAKRRALLDRICRTQTARGAAERDNADDDATLVSQTTTAALADASDDGWQGAATPLPEDDGAVTEDGALPDLLITSYDLLRRDVEDYQGIEFFCMTLDEAQYVKNHATKASKAVRSVLARHRFALTGTPIENRLAELWSIFDFLMPGMLGSYRHFRERFEQPVLSGDEHAQAKLQAFVGPFILRRLKSDVLKDLPDKIENVITVQLEGGQRRLYAALEQRLRASINKTRDVDFRNDRIQVLSQLTRLRQVCCDPRLVYENAAQLDAPSDGKRRTASPSAKLDAIQELVESCRDAGRKVLIFSQFTSYLDLIAERLRSIGMAYDTITGATPKKRRLELVDSFNADDTPVFLISLKAGNTGLNLTGACVVIHADPWWNAAAQNQATDRAHRIGQTQDVNVYQIVAKDTIEERILNLQQSKTDLASRFVDEASSSTGGSMAALTREDLLALLGG